ncbi:MAG: hypothetical protein AAF609_03125 [Cyanobacteria bacterium P01_C01_bin.120]
MSAAENQPLKASSSQDDDKSLSPRPKRPSLRQPPPRPEAADPKVLRPKASASMAPPPVVSEPPPEVPEAAVETPPEVPTNHPIAPPSEPMQYRAIGLVKGTYQPSEEQLNRGDMMTEDGTTMSAVLLGRVTSLIKKHIDLTESHLWVVYPRTRQPAEDEEESATDSGLHLQIVGVWEPDTLGLPGENPKTKAVTDEADTDADSPEAVEDTSEATEAAATEPVEQPVEVADSAIDAPAEVSPEPIDASPTSIDESEDEPDESPQAIAASSEAMETVADEAAKAPVGAEEEPAENYFSVRGEVLNYDEQTETILVKIVQGSKRSGKPPKAFKLNLFGQIAGKTVGYFWEFDIERQSEKLVVTDGRSIRMVPPKKKKKRKPSGPRRGGPRGGSDRPSRPSRNIEKPRIRPPAPVKSNPL